jgi:hypothetical protein
VKVALCALLIAGCVSAPPVPATLGSAEVVSDFDTYELRRVGLLPLMCDGIDPDMQDAIETALLTELDAATSFEIVRLDPDDLGEIPRSEPYRKGSYQPGTILSLARRYHLDGLFLATLTDQQFFSPMRLGLQVDLVAAETGLAVWTASVQLDTQRVDVKQSLDAWSQVHLGESETGTHVAYISPSRLARFAAWQIARLL